jgi:hypothetical protein
MPVQWPGAAVDSTGADLSAPVLTFLKDLNLLEDPQQHVTAFSTPASLQVITAGSTALSKTAASLVASVGGGAALWSAIKGFWIAQPQAQRLAYIAATALIVAVVALALALNVRADLHARALASAAEYDARAQAATAFLQTAQQVAGTRYVLKQKGRPGWFDVHDFQADGAGGLVAVIDGGQVPLANIAGLSRRSG